MIPKVAVKKLQKAAAVQETDDSSDEEGSSEEVSSKDVPEVPASTQWEKLQDIYFQKRFSRALNASQESLMEDEHDCSINLSKMYREKSNDRSTEKSSSLHKDPSQDTLDVIDDLIKSFEKEMNDERSGAEKVDTDKAEVDEVSELTSPGETNSDASDERQTDTLMESADGGNQESVSVDKTIDDILDDVLADENADVVVGSSDASEAVIEPPTDVVEATLTETTPSAQSETVNDPLSETDIETPETAADETPTATLELE